MAEETNQTSITVICYHCKQTYNPKTTRHQTIMVTDNSVGGKWVGCYNQTIRRENVTEKYKGCLAKIFPELSNLKEGDFK